MDKANFCCYHRSTCRGKLGCFIDMFLLLKIFICIFQHLIKIKNYRNNLANNSMVKLSDTWYEKLDQNGIKFYQQLFLSKRKSLMSFLCWKRWQLQRQCDYSRQQKQIMSLRNCENVPSLFQCIFSGCEFVKTFTMGRNKVSYIFQEGLGLLLAKRLCQSVPSSDGAYSLIFDETTTNQRQKQMDLLLHF